MSISPSFELEQRPQFEISPRDNEEFYRALLAPLAVSTIKYFLHADSLRQPILFLAIDKLRVRMSGTDTTQVNDPGYRSHSPLSSARSRR